MGAAQAFGKAEPLTNFRKIETAPIGCAYDSAMNPQHRAIVTIHRAAEMKLRERKALAMWLRKTATFLEQEGQNFSTRFTARYMKPWPSKRVPSSPISEKS